MTQLWFLDVYELAVNWLLGGAKVAEHYRNRISALQNMYVSLWQEDLVVPRMPWTE